MADKTTRRQFLKKAALAGAAITGLPALTGAAEKVIRDTQGKSPVVIATDKAMVARDGRIVQDVANRTLDRGIAKLMGTSSAGDAWGKLFSAQDVVGIKVNCLCGKGVSTRPEVVSAVIGGLKQAGVKEDNIIVWDRATSDLTKCGYEPNKDGPGVKCYGDDGDWGETIKLGVFNGRITKVISQKITALVNVPILKTHSGAGMSCCLKNHYGSFDNPGAHHDNHCNPAMADFNAIPAVKSKTRLVVIDALRPQYDGGPSLKADAQFDYYSLITARDPVAADACCLDIIEDKRAESGLDSIAFKVKWLQSAQDRDVGVCDRSKIDLIRV